MLVQRRPVHHREPGRRSRPGWRAAGQAAKAGTNSSGAVGRQSKQGWRLVILCTLIALGTNWLLVCDSADLVRQTALSSLSASSVRVLRKGLKVVDDHATSSFRGATGATPWLRARPIGPSLGYLFHPHGPSSRL